MSGYGNVNLGVDILKGNERPNAHKQELALEPNSRNGNQFNTQSEVNMPLLQENSENSVHENIKKELASGKPRAQAVAIALNTARESKQKGDVGTLNKKEIYKAKYQNRGETFNSKGTQEQEQPFL